MDKKFAITMVVVFLAVTACSYVLSMQLPAFSFRTLLVANVCMFAFTAIAFLITRKSLRERPQAFVRGVFSGTMLKMFGVLAAVLVYALVNKATLYKPVVFVFFGIYVVYTAAETILMSRMAKGAQ